MNERRPIGMFDSGLGGLTVARAVIDLLPHEDLIYFGDTARNPYGPRPVDEVRRFALEITDFLVEQDVKLVVVACNSAESAAFYEESGRYDVPIVTVIEPGVKSGLAATRNGIIGVIGTEATITTGAYEREVQKRSEGVTLISRACPKFVDFVEAGDTTSDAVFAAAEEYLTPLKTAGIDTLILGCTHYPLLSGVIQYVMGDGVVLISSAEVTANEVYARLKDGELLRRDDHHGSHRFITSSDATTFGELGRRFLGPEFRDVELRRWDP